MKTVTLKRIANHGLVLAMGFSAAGMAAAQSSNATLYGIIDQSLRFTNNRSDAGGTNLQITNGAITNSRWGLRGQEELGNGLKALFNLESGFDPHTGSLSDAKLFSRYAYVGLAAEDVGTFTLGRNNTEAFNLFGEFDPLTVGGYMANSWAYIMTVGRLDNMTNYAGQFGGLKVGLGYGFNNGFANNAYAYRGGRVSYNAGDLAFGATVQENRGANDKVQRMWGAAASYTLPEATIFVGYLGGRDATGFLDTVFTDLTDTSRTAPTPGDIIANPRKDMTLYTGVHYSGLASWSIRSGLYYSRTDNHYGIKDNKGKRYTAAVVAEYSLSKRTQAYGAVDYNKVSNGARLALSGKDKQLGLGVGLRHIF